MSEYAADLPLRVCVAGVTGWIGRAVPEAVRIELSNPSGA
jgi:hypothetical protein